MTIVEDDQEQIAIHRDHAIGMADLLARVGARGGARMPWTVDVAKQEAKLGPIEVGFYLLQNGGFSLNSYTRRDRIPDLTGNRTGLRTLPFASGYRSRMLSFTRFLVVGECSDARA
jgi:hypothetical protein